MINRKRMPERRDPILLPTDASIDVMLEESGFGGVVDDVVQTGKMRDGFLVLLVVRKGCIRSGQVESDLAERNIGRIA
jgi:hypothetical protein